MKKPSALFTLLSITLLASLHFGLAQDVTYVQVPAGSVQATQQPQVVYVQQVPAATPPQQTVVYQQVPAQTQPTVVQTVQQPTQQPNVVYVQQAPAPVQQQPQVVQQVQPQVVQQVQPQVVQQVQPQVVQQVQQTAPVTQQTQAAPQTTVVYQEVPVQTQPTVVAAPQQAQVVTQQPAATTTTQQVQQAQPAQVVVQQAPTTQPVQQAPVTSTPAPAPETVQAAAPTPTPAPTTTTTAPVQQAQPTTPPPTTEKKGGSLAESTYDTYYRPMESGADIDPNNINQKSSGLIDAKMSYIDAPLMDIVWCGEKKNVIFMLTEKSTLYRSEDDGFTGHVLTSHLHKLGKAELGSDPGEVGEVSRIIQSPVDKSLLIVMGTHGINWVTENCGSSFRAMNQGRHVDEFHFHPTEKNWVLASAWTICDDFVGEPCRNYKELFVSKDLGLNWDILHHYVYQFAWARLDHSFTDIPLDRVILSHDPNAKGNQTESGWKSHLMVSYIDNLDKKPVPFAMGGNKFLLSKNFLFVVMATDQSEKEVTLLVGSPKDKFYTLRPIEIPTKRISEHGYTVLDASEHSVFLHIDHGIDQGNHGTLYVSDSTGVRYSLALKNNVRDFSGQCDFEKVQGLEGIYLSNIYDAGALKRFQNIEAERASDFPVQHGGTKKTSADAFQHPDHYSADFQVNMRNNRADNAQKTLQDFKKTMISFDKGAMWQQLIPPERDSQGKKIVCRSEEECGLHLHSLSSRGFGPFYTTANSLGVILGTGNVGEFLSNHPDEVNTYLSRDGGLNWFEVAKGSHIYEIGDHGGLIVMAPDHNATRDVYYSWNEGITWERVRISEDYIHVTNIIIEPSNTAEKFMIYGKEVNGQRGFVAAVDFTSLHQRTCVFPTRPDTPESDYETWTPNGRISPHCLLGRQVSYVRRKRDAKCFNTEEHDEWKSTVPCQCTEEDWECDFGYMRQGTGACLPISDELTKYALVVPETCNSYYYMTQGYRKISGDSCQGGVSHEPIKLPCPGTGLLSAKNLSMFLMVGAILLVFVWLNKPQNMDMVKGVFEVYKEKVRARFARKPANQGYTQHIPGKYADEEDNFSNVLFDDNEEEAEEIAGPAEDGVDLISDSQSKKMTERKAMDAARKHVPLLNKPSDKKMESLKGGI